MPRFTVHDEAEADIAEAYAWYEARSDGLGEAFLAAIDFSVCRTASRAPSLSGAAPGTGSRHAAVRVERFPYGVFFIYDDGSDQLSMIACMHARRDPRRWLDRA